MGTQVPTNPRVVPGPTPYQGAHTGQGGQPGTGQQAGTGGDVILRAGEYQEVQGQGAV
jgi:hypothetical protein